MVELKLHHIGYAVKNMDKAITVYKQLGYNIETKIIDDFDRNIKITFVKNNETLIELISVLDDTQKSPIDFLFKKQFFLGNGMPYHICYSVENIDDAIKYLNSKNFRIIQDKAKAIAFLNKNVVFMFHLDIGMIELCENK